MRQGMVVAVGGQSVDRPGRSPRDALRAFALVLLVGLAALSGAGGMVGSASATNHATITNCGEEIDESGSYELSEDLSHIGDSACIEITVDDVVLDGHDHAIDGEAHEYAGVLVSGDGLENVTVRNLSVRSFETGLRFVSVDDVRIANVSVVSADEAGMELFDAPHSTILDSSVTEGSSLGIVLQESSDSRLERVSVNGIDDGESEVAWGIGAAVSRNVTVTNATVADIDGPGISLLGAQNSLVGNSSVTEATGSGVYLVPFFSEGETSLAGTEADVGSNVRLVNTEVHGTAAGLAPGIGGEFGEIYGGYGVFATGAGHVSMDNVTVTDSVGAGIDFRRTTEAPLTFDMTDSRVDGVATIEGTGAAINNFGAEGNLTNVALVDSEGDGVYSSVPQPIAPEGPVASDNGGDGVSIPGGDGVMMDLSVTDATIENSGERTLSIEGPGVLTATDIDIGASTAPATVVDAELKRASLASVAEAPPAPDGQSDLGRYVDVAEMSTDYSSYADVTVHYDDADVSDLDESTLSMYGLGDGWADFGGSIDESANAVSANVTGEGAVAFGVLAPFAEPAPPDEEPADDGPTAGGGGGAPGDDGTPSISVTDVSLSSDSIQPSETVTVDVTLTNDGDGDGSTTVNLTRDGDAVDSQDVVVRANDTMAFAFEYTVEEAGEYDFAANDVSGGTVTAAVQEADTQTPTPTPTATSTPTAAATPTATDAGGAAPTPAEPGDGLGPVLIFGAIAVLAGIVGAGLLLARDE